MGKPKRRPVGAVMAFLWSCPLNLYFKVADTSTAICRDFPPSSVNKLTKWAQLGNINTAHSRLSDCFQFAHFKTLYTGRQSVGLRIPPPPSIRILLLCNSNLYQTSLILPAPSNVNFQTTSLTALYKRCQKVAYEIKKVTIITVLKCKLSSWLVFLYTLV